MSGNSAYQKRVLTVAPMPPEKLAYALARYSRSPDSIRDSLDWVRTHDSAKFLESFYFQYGHASIADLGHLAICFEGVSELAATEIEDEQLWDGQARSSRYQDFSNSRAIIPPELSAQEREIYQNASDALLQSYRTLQQRAFCFLCEQFPQPEGMKPEVYRRNVTARAFDVARYLLPLGIPTGVGQVTSIRTLEKQVRRLNASQFQEVREIAGEIAAACAAPPECAWDGSDSQLEPVAPTLARHADRDEYAVHLHADLKEWASNRLPEQERREIPAVELLAVSDHEADICATLLYPVTDRPYRDLYELACAWSATERQDVLRLALGNRRREELPRHFRSAPYVFDFVMDVGAYRDLHRHRRCQQFRQQYTSRLGYETPDLVAKCGAGQMFSEAIRQADAHMHKLPQPAAQYLLPFASRSRFLFKMDFAELEYIARLRSGVKGHFSYRKIAWEMKQALHRLHPALADLIEATPPWIEDPLRR
jgi:thymidylate synthase ThyX